MIRKDMESKVFVSKQLEETVRTYFAADTHSASKLQQNFRRASLPESYSVFQTVSGRLVKAQHYLITTDQASLIQPCCPVPSTVNYHKHINNSQVALTKSVGGIFS